jgi:hypothetical protein
MYSMGIPPANGEPPMRNCHLLNGSERALEKVTLPLKGGARGGEDDKRQTLIGPLVH